MKKQLTWEQQTFLRELLTKHINDLALQDVPLDPDLSVTGAKESRYLTKEQFDDLVDNISNHNETYYEDLFYHFIEHNFDDVMDMRAMVKALATGIDYIFAHMSDCGLMEDLDDDAQEKANNIVGYMNASPRVTWGRKDPDDECNLDYKEPTEYQLPDYEIGTDGLPNTPHTVIDDKVEINIKEYDALVLSYMKSKGYDFSENINQITVPLDKYQEMKALINSYKKTLDDCLLLIKKYEEI